MILFTGIRRWLECDFSQLEDSLRQGLVPPVHIACPVWHWGGWRIELRGAAVWCSRWAPVVAMEISNTAEAQRKGTCWNTGAPQQMNEEPAEYRTGPQLGCPRWSLILFTIQPPPYPHRQTPPKICLWNKSEINNSPVTIWETSPSFRMKQAHAYNILMEV